MSSFLINCPSVSWWSLYPFHGSKQTNGASLYGVHTARVENDGYENLIPFNSLFKSLTDLDFTLVIIIVSISNKLLSKFNISQFSFSKTVSLKFNVSFFSTFWDLNDYFDSKWIL